MVCKRCGTELRNDDEFCYRCGQRTTVAQRMFSNRAFVGSLIAILIVVAAGIFTYFVWTGKIHLPIGNSSVEEPMTETGDRDIDKNDNDSGKDDGEDEQPAATPEETEEPAPTATPFAPANVTAGMKRELKPILSHARPYLALSSLYYSGGQHEFRWGDVPATRMSLYYLHAEKETVKYGDTYSSIQKKVKKEMKDVFGPYAKYDMTYEESYPGNMYRQTGVTVVFNLQRMGTRVGKMDVEKVIEYKEGRYRVVARGYVVESASADSRPQAEQRYTLYVERDEDGKYGYYIRKVALYKKKDGKVK